MSDPQHNPFLALALLGLTLFLCVFWPVYFAVHCISANNEQKQYERKALALPFETVSWAELARIYGEGGIYGRLGFYDAQDRKQADWTRYEGCRVRWSGEIVRIDQQNGWPSMIVKFAPDDWTGDVEVIAEHSQIEAVNKIHRGDQVTFTGVLYIWRDIDPAIILNHGIIESVANTAPAPTPTPDYEEHHPREKYQGGY